MDDRPFVARRKVSDHLAETVRVGTGTAGGAHVRKVNRNPPGPTLRLMRRLSPALRGPIAIGALLILAVLVAIPVLAASPSPSSGPGNGKSNGNGNGAKASHPPEVAVTVSGTVAAATDADGSATYSITTAGKTLRLEVGPPWFWGDKNPLKAYVGKNVTVVGEQSGDEIDVQSVNGTAVRQPGKPPWAGGWMVVGKSHPGWSQAKADRFAAKAADKAKRAAERAACQAGGTCPTETAEPQESEAP
jgi:hypothetical protein